MSPRSLAAVMPRLRDALPPGLASVLLIALPATARAQNERDRIDITGRQNLTLGSGARAYGMGGAFLARADDATAASWNPAGLSYLRLPELTVVGVLNRIVKDSPLTGAAQDAALRSDHFRGQSLDFAAFTWPVGFLGVRGAVQVSYQRAIAFDGSREIAELGADATGSRLRPTRTDDVHSDGGFDVIALGTGLRLTRSLRAGLVVNRWLGGYSQTLTRTVFSDTTRPLRELDLGFHPHGWSGNLGFIWSPAEPVSVASVYKMPFRATVGMEKSRRDYWGGALDAIDEVTTNFYKSNAVRLDLPASFGFGCSWRPRDTVTLSADITRTTWSQARIRNYFDVGVTGETGADGVPAPKPEPVIQDPWQYPTLKPVPASDDPNDPKRVNGQQDAQQIRFGIEWVLIRGDLRVPLRTGYFNDRQIERNLDGSVPRYNGFTTGAGVAFGSVLLDLAYVYEHGAAVIADPAEPGSAPVRSSLTTHRVLASAIYRFGGRR